MYIPSIFVFLGLCFLSTTLIHPTHASDSLDTTAPSKTDDSSCGCSKGRSDVSSDSNEDTCTTPTKDSSSSPSTTDFSSSSSSPSSSPSRNLNHLYEVVRIPAGWANLGTDEPHFVADAEGPSFPYAQTNDIYMDRYEVSNLRFAEFVAATGYKTEAEVYGWSFVHEHAVPPHISETITQSVAGTEWWLPVPNASWSSPEGLGTSVVDRMDHPALHISKRDGDDFCKWAGGRIPSESEWEYAARGGKPGRMYPWGNKKVKDEEGADKDATHRMNIWQGKFPNVNTGGDGYMWAAPVDSYGSQNNYGLYNIMGNIWEWTSTTWCPNISPNGSYIPANLQTSVRVPPECLRLSPPQRRKMMEDIGEIDFVKKGGSFMCHKDYCYRYRIPARHKNTANSSAYNLGIRCVYDKVPKWATAIDATKTVTPPKDKKKKNDNNKEL